MGFFIRRKDKIEYDLSKVVGPSPWYYETFPYLKDSDGREFSWLFHGTKGEYAYLVSFGEKDKESRILVLNSYVRPFIVQSNLLGVWFHDDNNLIFQSYNPLTMKEFILSEIPSDFKESKKPIFKLSEPISEFKINKFLEEGEHQINIPQGFGSEEILAVGPYQDFKKSEVIYAIYSIFPDKGRVLVYPQKWFTHENFDIGYQWITRVLRVPKTGRIIGDGIRIGVFELTSDYCNLERWVNK